MKIIYKLISVALLTIMIVSCKSQKKDSIVFASYIVGKYQFSQTLNLCESLRTFGGELSNAPFRIYVNDKLKEKCKDYQDRFKELSIEVHYKKMPAEAYQYFLGYKPCIAGQAEKDAENEFDLVVLLDANILILDEPKDFILNSDKALAYRPVMHKNIGLLFNEEPNEYWKNVYDITDVDQTTFFPMQAIADKNLLKPYFNAGLLVVRPEYKILQSWDTYFKKLSMDTSMIELCKNPDERYNVFLHQAALVGAILNNVQKEDLTLLPTSYNYPIFFEKFYGSELEFDSLEDIISIKYEFDFTQLPDD